MTTPTYRDYSGTAAQLYESFFVPAIAGPAAGELLAEADLRPGERVLDVACGTGLITRAAAERVGPTGAVAGVDIAPDMIEVAKATPAVGGPIEWHQADATSLPFPDGFFDIALCQMGLMFIPDKQAAINELRRVIAPGGRAVINTPGTIQPFMKTIESAIADHIDPQLGGFVAAVFSMPDPQELADLLAEAGFEDVEGRTYSATFEVPGPAEFLWNYINLTPMAAPVAAAPDEAKAAMEAAVEGAWEPSPTSGLTPFEQPMALASARRR